MPAARAVRAGRCAAALLGALVLTAPAWRAPLVGDDFEAIAGAVASGPSLRWLTDLTIGGHVRPILVSTLWANWALGGTDPVGYRVVGALLHGAAACAVGWLTAELVAVAGPWRPRAAALASTLAGALFLVAPIHTEPLLWIAARVHLLSAIAAVVCVASWLRGRRRGRRWDVVSAAALLLAALAMELAVVVVLVLPLAESWLPDDDPRRRRPGAVARRLLPHAVALGLVAMAWLPHRATLGRELGVVPGGPIRSVGRAGTILVRSLVPPLPSGWSTVAVAVVLVMAVAVILTGLRLGSPSVRSVRLRLAGFLASSAVVVALPASRFGTDRSSIAGERFAYLSSAFLVVGIAVVLASAVARWPRAGSASVVAVLAAAAGMSLVGVANFERAAAVNQDLVVVQGRWPVGERQILLAAPDTLDGVWVGRSAYSGSLVLEHGWTFQEASQLRQLAGLAMASPSDGVAVRPGPCDSCLTLETDGGAQFVWPYAGEPVSTPGETRVVSFGPHRIVVEVADEDLHRLWYLRDGQLAAWTPR